MSKIAVLVPQICQMTYIFQYTSQHTYCVVDLGGKVLFKPSILRICIYVAKSRDFVRGDIEYLLTSATKNTIVLSTDDTQMNVAHWWNNNWRGKPKLLENNLTNYLFIHQRTTELLCNRIKAPGFKNWQLTALYIAQPMYIWLWK